MMIKFLTFIDIFGEPVKIYLNKETEIKTTFGGVLSLLMMILVMVFAWFMGKDIILRENPFSYEQNLVSSNFPKSEINAINFPFSVVITDFNNVPWMDDRMIQLKLYYTLTQSNEKQEVETQTLQTVQLEPCNFTHFPALSEDQFVKAQLSNTYCLKQQNFTLQGFWGENKILYINLAAEMCDYDSFPDYCHSNEEIKNTIASQGANFNIYYLQKAVDIKNFTNPFKNYVALFYKYFDSNKNKVCEYFLQNQSIVTDFGLIFEDTETENYYTLTEIHTDSLDFNPENKQLINFVIYSSNTSSKIFRKYIKAPDILASLGGLIKIIQMVFTLGNMGFSRVKKFETVINNVFDFSLSSVHNLKRNIDLSYCKDLSDLMSNLDRSNALLKNKKLGTGTNNLERGNIKLNSNMEIENSHQKLTIYNYRNNCLPKSKLNGNSLPEKIMKNLRSRREKMLINLNFGEIMAIMFPNCCNKKLKKKKLETYLLGESKIKEYFDFINIIIHLEEFEALKKIIFNENQKILFELNINPKLRDERKERNEKITNITVEKIEEHLKEFMAKISDPKHSEIDENLFKFLLNA